MGNEAAKEEASTEESTEESTESEESSESTGEKTEKTGTTTESTEKTETTGKKEGEKKEEEAERIIPDEYNLKLPKDSTVDEAYVQHIETYAKQNKLTQEEAEATLEAQIKFTEDATKQRTEAWEKEAKADDTIGGENYSETQRIAQKLLTDHADEAFQKVVKDSGFDKNPGFLRFLTKLGAGLKDDKTIPGGSPAKKEEPKSAAEVLYGKEKAKAS